MHIKIRMRLFVCSSSVEDEGSREKGALYRWQGYFCGVTPERLLLSRPVLHAALGNLHGLLLTEGQISLEMRMKRQVTVVVISLHALCRICKMLIILTKS